MDTTRTLPSGTVTFLFTDIEGSTMLWEQHPDAMRVALARHDALLRDVILAHGGCVFKTVGDQFCAAFATAPNAIAAALAAQRALHAANWGEVGTLRVRMALTSGVAEVREGDYFGPPLNRVARLLDAGHGGQVLLSSATQELVRDQLPEGATLQDLGEHRLRDLIRSERIFQLAADSLAADFPPLDTLDARPNNLPAQATPFIGREQEIAAAREMLRRGDLRLLTLVGPGGTGKTRLGLQIAVELLDTFASGVFFVALAPLRDPDLVPTTIAQTLGVREMSSRPLLDTLKEYLRDRQMLLLLDNFEQVVAAGPVVADLLASCPRLKVLVTSRAVLHLCGEHEFPVPPLAVPDPKRLPSLETFSQYAAVQLFIQRALAVKADFSVTNDNALAVAAICHRLDGLPLAIELAAARVKLLSPQALLVRLENRLKLLVGGARDLPARHQTLRGAIAWSYDLLEEGEQRLFRRLAVFVGGCTPGSVEAVCDGAGEMDAWDGLASLVDHSLLRQEEPESGTEDVGDVGSRFLMLETVREYAKECLQESGESDAIRRRHAQFFLAQAEAAEPHLTTAAGRAWLAALQKEHDNARAVLRWAAERGSAHGDEAAELGLRLASALMRFWWLKGYATEGRQWLERLLSPTGDAEGSRDSVPTVVHARALAAAGTLASLQGDQRAARALHGQTAAIARELGDRRLLADALHGLTRAAAYQGDYEAARAFGEESEAVYRDLCDRPGLQRALHTLTFVERETGDYERAWTRAEECLAIARELGDVRYIFLPFMNMGTLRLLQGDLQGARAGYETGLAGARELGDQGTIAIFLGSLGRLARHEGDWEAARSRLNESLILLQTQGFRGELSMCLAGLACVAVAHGGGGGGKPEPPDSVSPGAWLPRAIRLFGAAEVLREETGVPIWRVDRAEYEGCVAAAKAALGDAAFAAAWAEGRAMTLEEAVRVALEELDVDTPMG